MSRGGWRHPLLCPVHRNSAPSWSGAGVSNPSLQLGRLRQSPDYKRRNWSAVAGSSRILRFFRPAQSPDLLTAECWVRDQDLNLGSAAYETAEDNRTPPSRNETGSSGTTCTSTRAVMSDRLHYLSYTAINWSGHTVTLRGSETGRLVSCY